MTTTTKIIWIFLLLAACALALALFPRAAGGTNVQKGTVTTASVSCVFGEVSQLHSTLRFERDASTRADSCALRFG